MSDHSQPAALPQLPSQELLAWCHENTWLCAHGKPGRTFIDDQTHQRLRPVFDLLKCGQTDLISLDQLLDMLSVLGDPITPDVLQQMLRRVSGRTAQGVTYLQFVQLVTRNHVVRLAPQPGREQAGQRIVVYEENIQAMMRAYCRKQMVNGVIADKDNWRSRVRSVKQSLANGAHIGRPRLARAPSSKASHTSSNHRPSATMRLPAQAASMVDSAQISNELGLAHFTLHDSLPGQEGQRSFHSASEGCARDSDGLAAAQDSQSLPVTSDEVLLDISQNSTAWQACRLNGQALDQAHRKARARLIAQMGPVSGKMQVALEDFMQLRSSDPTQPVMLPKAWIAACTDRHQRQFKDRPVLAAQRVKLQAHREVLAACQA